LPKKPKPKLSTFELLEKEFSEQVRDRIRNEVHNARAVRYNGRLLGAFRLAGGLEVN